MKSMHPGLEVDIISWNGSEHFLEFGQFGLPAEQSIHWLTWGLVADCLVHLLSPEAARSRGTYVVTFHSSLSLAEWREISTVYTVRTLYSTGFPWHGSSSTGNWGSPAPSLLASYGRLLDKGRPVNNSRGSSTLSSSFSGRPYDLGTASFGGSWPLFFSSSIEDFKNWGFLAPLVVPKNPGKNPAQGCSRFFYSTLVENTPRQET